MEASPVTAVNSGDERPGMALAEDGEAGQRDGEILRPDVSRYLLRLHALRFPANDLPGRDTTLQAAGEERP